jgi:GNAT superfamily N-acetyltransferase
VSSDTFEPVPLLAAQIAEAGALMGRAFSPDPISVHAFADPDERSRALAALCEWIVRSSHLFAEVYVTPGALDGMLILQRTHLELTDERLPASGWDDLPAALGPGPYARFTSEFMRIYNHAETGLHDAATPDAWYLDQLAVEPGRQGAGIGGRFVRWLNDLADANGATVSLLTFQPKNVGFYARYGYPVIAEGAEPISGVRYWGFERKPAPRPS